MLKTELAVKKHNEGYNCAQAVVCSFAEEIGISEAELYRMSEGFGGGLGCAQGQCGALSGAAILAGLANSDSDVENPGQTKRVSCRKSAEMLKLFKEKTGAIICFELKGSGSGKVLASCDECIIAATEAVQEILGL